MIRTSLAAFGAASMLALAPMAQADDHGEMSKDIVETAMAADDFETLVAAVKAAGLVETLQGEGPFTVFAPTDAAFGDLPEGTVESLLEEENKEKLQSILTYHVVPGAVMSSDLSGEMEVETVEGSTLTIDASGDGVMVGDASVVQADIEASNGVIHVIDGVLMP
jgi:uncharacterized surface protein with fasciclin (FAS1) repeats